jgi:NAD(P)-dependent dehydrogenase (short-subunit alcohol dehydrogenase family)
MSETAGLTGSEEAAMTETTGKTALIIGASRGLGYALAAEYLVRGWQVTATVRGARQTDLHHLACDSGGRLVVETVDITVPEEVAALHDRLAPATFDLLFVNAGVTNGPEETVADVSTDTFIRLMVTNALSPMRVIEALQDLAPDGTIGVMSSGQGSVANNEKGGFEIYRASKSALNQLMRSFAARHADDPRTLLLIAPGWVQTSLGGPGAPLTIDQSIPGVVDTIEAQTGKGGLQYLNYRGQAVRW